MSKTKDQTGRIALVTGANRGLGFETCRQLAQCGFHVILTSHDSQQGVEATSVLCAEGLNITHHLLDVTKPEHVARTHDFVINKYGMVGYLVFLITELRDRLVLERAHVNIKGFDAILGQDIRPSIYLYTRDTDGFDIRARMFAPLSGVPEDPATGSASCAVAGLLAHFNGNPSGDFSWRIVQGVEMGRPSTLLARAEKADGVVQATLVGGGCVLVSEGFIHVD